MLKHLKWLAMLPLALAGCGDNKVTVVNLCTGVDAIVTPARADGYWEVQVVGASLKDTDVCSVTRMLGATIVEQTGFRASERVTLKAVEGDVVLGECGGCSFGPYFVPEK